MFQKSIGSVLGGFQFYSNCDFERDWPSDGIHLQGKTRTKTVAQQLNFNSFTLNGKFFIFNSHKESQHKNQKAANCRPLQ